ncbi:MAG: hypothetical protein M3299_06495 [Thermoproteota archaeon]|nr:hypothetical protein [Thermoproteota archaeon]
MTKSSITTDDKIVINWVLTLTALVLQSWTDSERSMRWRGPEAEKW